MTTPEPATGSRRPTTAPSLTLTGERTLPGIPDERYWYERHVAAYLRAASHIQRLDASCVLDAGCGEGYGLALLADAGANRVIGADLDVAVVEHARSRYAAADGRIEVVRAELMSLPLGDGEVDVTVSFQVIEHLHDIPGYLRSLHRVTRRGGVIMIATPNRLTFTPDGDVPVNPFHTREFTAAELTHELVAAGLEVREVVGVHHGPELRAIEVRTGVPFVRLLSTSAPDAWPAWLRDTVHRVEASWFEVRPDELDGSLDLVATCRVPTGRHS